MAICSSCNYESENIFCWYGPSDYMDLLHADPRNKPILPCRIPVACLKCKEIKQKNINTATHRCGSCKTTLSDLGYMHEAVFTDENLDNGETERLIRDKYCFHTDVESVPISSPFYKKHNIDSYDNPEYVIEQKNHICLRCNQPSLSLIESGIYD